MRYTVFTDRGGVVHWHRNPGPGKRHTGWWIACKQSVTAGGKSGSTVRREKVTCPGCRVVLDRDIPLADSKPPAQEAS